MRTIYVLQCENNRYYIGKTDRPLETRVEEHFNRCGSEWTRKYRPIKVVEIKQNADEFDEDKYTKLYIVVKKDTLDKQQKDYLMEGPLHIQRVGAYIDHPQVVYF
jgi:predicted GIY-YIG superfamily endonuclease